MGSLYEIRFLVSILFLMGRCSPYLKKKITFGTDCSCLTQLALLVRGRRSNDAVILKGFLAVVLLLYKRLLFLRVKSSKVQSDFKICLFQTDLQKYC